MANPNVIMRASVGDVLSVTHLTSDQKRLIYEGRVRSVLTNPLKGCYLEFEDRDYKIMYLIGESCTLGSAIVEDIEIL